jgi:hypothetical protein
VNRKRGATQKDQSHWHLLCAHGGAAPCRLTYSIIV